MTLQQRVAEAESLLGSIPGVVGLILGGSAGPGEAWPLSDVDIVVVYADTEVATAQAELERRRSLIEDFWGWCGVSGSLDLGDLWFTESEAAAAIDAGAAGLAERISPGGGSRAPVPGSATFRWLHAMDAAYSGRVLLATSPVVLGLAELFTENRFEPAVSAARVAHWAACASSALAAGDSAAAAEAMIDWSTERWGGRCGSMSRRWTWYEASARRHGYGAAALRILAAGGALDSDVAPRVEQAPWWLRHRIAAALDARRHTGEAVTPQQNARDQLIAFARRWHQRGLPAQPWSQPVASTLPDPVAELTSILGA